MGLVVRGLSKTYGAQVALDSVGLTLESGIVALLGANGSGKSTLLGILATLIQPDSGTIRFNSLTYPQRERQLRTQIGYLPQTINLPDAITPRKLLAHLARLRGVTTDSIAQFQLQALADRPFHQLSTGQRRIVGLAQAFLGAPRLLLLDEFARGLDVNEREWAFRLIQQPGKLVIFSTHIPAEIESAGAQTVVVLDRGRVLFCGSVEQMRAAAVGFVHEIRVPKEDAAAISATWLVSRITPNGTSARMRVITPSAAADAVVVAPTLEDAYLFLTRRVP